MGYRSVCQFNGSQTSSFNFLSKSYQNGSKMRAGDPRSGVNNFFVNTTVTALQGSDWERLLERYAPTSFRDILHVSYARRRNQDWGERYVSFVDRSEHIRASTQRMSLSVDRNAASFSSISNHRPRHQCVNWPRSF
jgi:hypothetical protein